MGGEVEDVVVVVVVVVRVRGRRKRRGEGSWGSSRVQWGGGVQF